MIKISKKIIYYIIDINKSQSSKDSKANASHKTKITNNNDKPEKTFENKEKEPIRITNDLERISFMSRLNEIIADKSDEEIINDQHNLVDVKLQKKSIEYVTFYFLRTIEYITDFEVILKMSYNFFVNENYILT